MNNEPLVSVLMPAYNQAQYISDALDSLLNQTYTNWECAIVDDGSPDNVAAVVEKYVESDPRIKFYHTDNRGVSAARNFAASNTSGEFIIPLDADDYFEPQYISSCIESFKKNRNLDLVYCKWRMFGDPHKSLDVAYIDYKNLLIANTIFSAAMYRRTDFERVGGYDTKIPFGFEDWEFWISLLNKDSKVYQIPKKLFNYRIKNTSRNTVTNIEENKKSTLAYICKKHIDTYLDFYPDLIYIIQWHKYYERRNEKWKNRPLLSRLWHAIKGTI